MQSTELLYNCRAELLWGNSVMSLINSVTKIKQHTNCKDATWTYKVLIKQPGTEPSFHSLHNKLSHHRYDLRFKFNRRTQTEVREQREEFARRYKCYRTLESVQECNVLQQTEPAKTWCPSEFIDKWIKLTGWLIDPCLPIQSYRLSLGCLFSVKHTLNFSLGNFSHCSLFPWQCVSLHCFFWLKSL